MIKDPQDILTKMYDSLYRSFGPQHWWPGETSFEVIIGAILTQNTNWNNVEKAILNLRRKKLLTPLSLRRVPEDQLALLIKPAGYFNVKADRLKCFIEFLFVAYEGDLKRMGQEKWPVLRKKILSVKGIGPETADSILLYAFNKPIFVVDAYTKRVLLRHGLIHENMDYHQIQELFMTHLVPNIKMFNEYHALIVRLGKEYCKKTKPLCERCPLKEIFNSCHLMRSAS